jgi:ATP-dependent Zn proteases
MTTELFIDTIPAKLRKRYTVAAYHEAGHAIVAHQLGRRLPRKVSVVPMGSTLGRVEHSPWPSSSRPDLEITARTRALVEAQIVTLLAGPEAERHFTGRSNRVGAGSDFSKAAGLAIYVGGDGEGATAYLKWCSFCARRSVDFNWHAIERFAKRLIEAGVLGGQKLTDALVEASLRPGMTMEQHRTLQSGLAAVAKKLAARKAAAVETRPNLKKS